MVGNQNRKFALEDDSQGQPDTEIIEKARDFAREIMRKQNKGE